MLADADANRDDVVRANMRGLADWNAVEKVLSSEVKTAALCIGGVWCFGLGCYCFNFM